MRCRTPLFKIISFEKQIRLTSTELFLSHHSKAETIAPPHYVGRYQRYRIVWLSSSIQRDQGKAFFFDDSGKHDRSSGIEGLPRNSQYNVFKKHFLGIFSLHEPYLLNNLETHRTITLRFAMQLPTVSKQGALYALNNDQLCRVNPDHGIAKAVPLLSFETSLEERTPIAMAIDEPYVYLLARNPDQSEFLYTGLLDQEGKAHESGIWIPLSGKHCQIQTHQEHLFLLEEAPSPGAPVSIQIFTVTTHPKFGLNFISDISHGTPILKSAHTYLPTLLQGLAKSAGSYFRSPINGFTIFDSVLLGAPCILSFHNVIRAFDFKGNEINMGGLTKEVIMSAISPEPITLLDLQAHSKHNEWDVLWKKNDVHEQSYYYLTTLRFG